MLTMVWAAREVITQLPNETVAVYAIVTGLLSFLPIFTSAFTSGISRFVIVHLEANELDAISELATSMFIVICIAALLLMSLSYVIFANPSILGVEIDQIESARIVFVLLLITAIFQFLAAPFSVGLIARENYVLVSLISSISQIFRSILIILFFLIWAPSIEGLAIASFIAETAAVIFTAYFSVKSLPELHFSRGYSMKKYGWPIFQFGVWSSVAQVASAIRMGATPILLATFSSSASVTAFFAASVIERNLRAIISALVSPIEPVFTKEFVRGDLERYTSIFKRYNELLLWLTTPVVMTLVFLSKEVMSVFIDSDQDIFLEAYHSMLILTMSLTCFTILLPISAYFRANNRLRHFVIRVLIVQIVAFIVLSTLLAYGGIGSSGAALVLLFSSIFNVVIVVPQISKETKISLGSYGAVLFRGGLPSIICIPLGVFLNHYVAIPMMAPLAIKLAFLLLLSYLITVVIFYKELRGIIFKIVGRGEAKYESD
jgi:Na+-driven multidrug efflux pump